MKTIKIDEQTVEVDGIKYVRAEEEVWPQEGDKVWFLPASGKILRGYFSDSWQVYLNQGNIFRTEEEAEHERDRQMLLAKLEREACENETTCFRTLNHNSIFVEIRYSFETQEQRDKLLAENDLTLLEK